MLCTVGTVVSNWKCPPVQGKLASHFVTSLTSSLSQTETLSGMRLTSETLGDRHPTSSGNQH